jgi:hypothetical protein
MILGSRTKSRPAAKALNLGRQPKVKKNPYNELRSCDSLLKLTAELLK